ncbi:CLUMA_CG006017, isoform A [Clunio marinus]|uniref:CLUMA_CG006017, isoform A n=1 Tax=Clunio marinus TaxID=568069 RepID=A0A1J1HWH5_9DIPT|nr:CLUMA_CG006017, isoform A [Clunio marinus]
MKSVIEQMSLKRNIKKTQMETGRRHKILKSPVVVSVRLIFVLCCRVIEISKHLLKTHLGLQNLKVDK